MNIEVESVDVDRSSHVTIRFGDGITGRFGVEELRLACPCAECDGRRRQGRPVAPVLDDTGHVTVTDARLTGAFGLDLDWSDGHRTGIYGWAYLRELLDAGTLGHRT
jgi:DUF971 family protein